MKKFVSLISVLCFMFFTNPVQAAFVCGTSSPVATAVNSDTSTQYVSYHEQHTTWHDGWYGQHGRFNGEAHRAIRWAMWGLFFWPLGIFAVVHGFRALRRRNPDNDLAVLAIIIGSIEILASIWFVFAFIWWWPFFPGLYVY